jgi:predicted RNA-binding protein YlqC (UPF0109 family)
VPAIKIMQILEVITDMCYTGARRRTHIPYFNKEKRPMTAIKEMVEYIAKNLADEPDAVQVSESIGESIIMIEMNVASNDMGRMIGRKGRTINSIRSLARILGAKMEKKVSVEII